MILLNLFLTFLKIGAFTFGGGYAMVPLIQAEMLRNMWLTGQEVIDFIGVSESTPGPLAVNMSTFAGFQVAGVPGAFFATLGVVLPSFIIILVVAGVYEKFQNSRVVKGMMRGLKPAVLGLVGSALVTTGEAVFKETDIIGLVIILVAFWGGFFALRKKVHPIWVIVVLAVVGIIGYR